jgi:5'-3' exonuclease
VILIDGDMLVYRVGFACDEESEKTATRTMGNYISEMLTDLADHYPKHRVFLTGRSNFRDEVATSQPYKGDRPPRKPVHKDALRDYLVNKWGASVSENKEADDDIAIAAATVDYDCIICSLDKDFKQIPCRLYDYTKKKLTTVNQEEAELWIYKQALMGDRVDNILGVKGIGPKKADKLIDPCTSESEAFDVCLKTYEENDLDRDRLVESLTLLYLLRSEDDKYNVPNETE